MKIRAAKRVVGRLTLPGDKSISHRVAIVAALADGTSAIENFSTSRDCATTLNCLGHLGVLVHEREGFLEITGVGLRGFKKPLHPLDCGNSGSTIRMLAGVLAAQNFTSRLTGDRSLSVRPMRRIIEPLEKMGASISSSAYKPPLEITGNPQLQGIDYELPIPSAQVKTAMLLAGLCADGPTMLTERRVTRDHSERLLKFVGVPISSEALDDGGKRISVSGPAQPSARNFKIPGDISSAAFFIAAASLLEGSDLRIEDVGLNPTRTQFISTFRWLGLNVGYEPVEEWGGEPVGLINVSCEPRRVNPSFQSANRLPADLVPALIDELPLIGVVGSQIAGGITVRGASELRYKESDRIAATVNNLRAMGVDAKEFEDGFVVRGPQKLRGASLRSYGDHRIAMAFTVAALLADGESELDEADCVAVSFPEFFEMLEALVQR